MIIEKQRAGRNRTITLTKDEGALYELNLIKLDKPTTIKKIINKTINQDLFEVLDLLPKNSVDLLFVDPPYNLNKSFNGKTFNRMDPQRYSDWMESWFTRLLLTLKKNASVYICGDWVSSISIFEVVSKYLKVQNRITWEREKGRGAKSNWKNASEDIWFCTVSDDFYFDVDAVKMKRKVMAPYKENGVPKDWEETVDGNFRLTHPSNLWTDISVPFWSMPENTDHPTQKPEKLLAKIILASSRPGDLVLDPFLGSGTTSVVAKKLGRQFVGIEIDRFYSCVTEKRLALADADNSIQGYTGGFFWERNSLT